MPWSDWVILGEPKPPAMKRTTLALEIWDNKARQISLIDNCYSITLGSCHLWPRWCSKGSRYTSCPHVSIATSAEQWPWAGIQCWKCDLYKLSSITERYFSFYPCRCFESMSTISYVLLMLQLKAKGGILGRARYIINRSHQHLMGARNWHYGEFC
jgi:hypothetical protein